MTRPPDPVGLTTADIEALGREVARSLAGPSPRAIRNARNMNRMLERGQRAPAPWDRPPAPLRAPRKRCDARVKHPVKFKNGVAIARNPRCRAWAMPSGRCRVHGGWSTGPRTPEGMANTVAALIEGRIKWIARVRARSGVLPMGRKTGEAWVTKPMRERARAEAQRLGLAGAALDRPLVCALIRSAKGEVKQEAKARALHEVRQQAERAPPRPPAPGTRGETDLKRVEAELRSFLPSSRPYAWFMP